MSTVALACLCVACDGASRMPSAQPPAAGGGSGASGAVPGDGASGGVAGGGGTSGGAACDLAAAVTVTTLDSGIAGPLAVDDRDVYFLAGQPTALYAAPKSGGEARLIAAADDFALDDDAIYVLAGGSLARVDKASGASRAFDGGDAAWVRIAAAHGDVYAIQPRTPPVVVSLGAATAQTLAAESSRAPARALVADDTQLLWTDDAGVWRVARSGGTPALVSRDRDGRALATDGKSLFVARATTVYAIAASLAEAPIYDEANVTGLASDGHALYVAGDNGVARVSADGRARSVVSPDAAAGVAVDDRYVYFVARGGVQKACK